MKRDMDLVRDILLAIERENNPLADMTLRLALGRVDKSQSSGSKITVFWRNDQVLFGHVGLLKEDGLVSTTNYEDTGTFKGLRMTPKGHDFLDSIRDFSIWGKVRSKMGGMTSEIGKQSYIALLIEAAKKLWSLAVTGGQPS